MDGDNRTVPPRTTGAAGEGGRHRSRCRPFRRGGRDRGEVGPIGYAVMVAGIVLLAVAVVAWGNEVADTFMGRIEGVDLP